MTRGTPVSISPVIACWMQRLICGVELLLGHRWEDKGWRPVCLRVLPGKQNRCALCENWAKWISAAAWENTFSILKKGSVDFFPLFQKMPPLMAIFGHIIVKLKRLKYLATFQGQYQLFFCCCCCQMLSRAYTYILIPAYLIALWLIYYYYSLRIFKDLTLLLHTTDYISAQLVELLTKRLRVTWRFLW